MEYKEIKYGITEKDFIKFMFWFVFVRGIRLFLFAAAIIYVLVQVIFYNGSSDFMNLFLLYLIVFMPLIQYFSFRRRYRKYQDVYQNLGFKFNETEIIFSAEQGDKPVNWTEVIKLVDKAGYLILQFDRRHVIFIPKRDLSDTNIELIKNYVYGIEG